MRTLGRCACLSGNTLKLIAAVLMTVDHAGALLFPEVILLRAIGRPGYPLFAFTVAEGCRYTRSRLRHFVSVFTVAAVCQVAFTVATGSYHLNALITLSIGILLCYALDTAKSLWFAIEAPLPLRLFGLAVFPAAVAAVFALTTYAVSLDYGFFGCMVPVFASLLHPPRANAPEAWERLDRNGLHVASTALGQVLLGMHSHSLNYFALFAIPVLLMYSGKRGRLRLKYFFYIYYPAHFLILVALAAAIMYF